MIDGYTSFLLRKMARVLESVIIKADRENEKWVRASPLDKKLKPFVVLAIDEFEQQMESFFSTQQKEYLLRIGNLTYKRKRRTIRKAKKDSPTALVAMITEFVLADDEHYINLLMDLYEAFATKTVLSSAKIIGGAVKGTQMERQPSLTDKTVKWIQTNKIKFARDVQQSTRDSITRVLTNGLISHEGTQPTVTGLYQLFLDGKLDEFNKGLKRDVRTSNTFDWNRARTVARTETMSAGTLEGFRLSKVVTGKKWRCEGGPRSRSSHKAADNQTVPIDKPFIVGGYELMHPGDRSRGAAAKEVINCRCTMSGVSDAVVYARQKGVKP